MVGCGSNCTSPYRVDVADYVTLSYGYTVRADAPIGINFNSNGAALNTCHSNHRRHRVVGVGFEPTKAVAGRFTVCSV